MLSRSSNGAGAYASDLAEAFEAALRDYVASIDSHRSLARYATQSGHRTRPVGCLLCCAAVSGHSDRALGVSVGIELLHKSSVVRDDIVDGDRFRSGQLAVHTRYGVSTAIALSDFLWTSGLRQIRASAPEPYRSECLSSVISALHEMAVGQLEDVDPTPGMRGVGGRLRVSELKTGSLSALACRLGALVGGGSPRHVELLSTYGRKIGTAFQVLNDVRDVTGVEKLRIAGSDLRNRRSTVISALAMEKAAGAGVPFGAHDELSDADVRAVRRHVLDSGAVQLGVALASTMLGEARDALRGLPENWAVTTLESLTQGVLEEQAF